MLAAALILQVALSPAPARGTVVTDTFWSQALGIHKQLVVYLPPSYARKPERRYPVAYYLHGLYGRETDWTRFGALHDVMDSLVAAGGAEMIVAMPDGDDGWYTTWNTLPSYDACVRAPPRRESAETYCVPWPHYDDYIANDLVQFVDRKYRTIPTKVGRAIAGLSMGGYGAVALALSYPNVFSAAASHSGVLAPLYNGPHPFNGHPEWLSPVELERGLAPYWPFLAPAFGRDTAMWWSRDPGRKLARLIASKGEAAVPALFVDVGSSDDLVDESREFRWQAERLGRRITYHEWPGAHDFTYWRAHVGESLSWIASIIAR
jgi:S-formylglutathione hydrolase FrmB